VNLQRAGAMLCEPHVLLAKETPDWLGVSVNFLNIDDSYLPEWRRVDVRAASGLKACRLPGPKTI
jgi:hypothetical protein